MMNELRGTSTLFGSNAPFIEQQYEIYLANPGAVGADWRAYFDQIRDGAQDVAHAPVIDSFIQLAKSRRLAAPMVDAQAMHKQVLVLRLISKYRTLGVFQADLDPQPAHPVPSDPGDACPVRRRREERVGAPQPGAPVDILARSLLL